LANTYAVCKIAAAAAFICPIIYFFLLTISISHTAQETIAIFFYLLHRQVQYPQHIYRLL
jgi:hypothetical protein